MLSWSPPTWPHTWLSIEVTKPSIDGSGAWYWKAVDDDDDDRSERAGMDVKDRYTEPSRGMISPHCRCYAKEGTIPWATSISGLQRRAPSSSGRVGH